MNESTQPALPSPREQPALPWSKRAGLWTQVDTGTGWFPLIEQLAADLHEQLPGYQVVQVKEKFGGLRFYIDLPQDATAEQQAVANERIRLAEEMSMRTCDECGQPGQLRTGSWSRTLCDRCVAASKRTSSTSAQNK